MAVALRSFTTATSANADTAITKPSGCVDGDLLVTHITLTSTAVTITTLSGWTLKEGPNNSTGSDARAYVFYRIASSEGATYTWHQNAGPASIVIQCLCFSGVDGTTPIEVSATPAAPAAGTSHASGNAVTSTGGDLMVYLAGFDGTTTGVGNQWTPPTGYSEQTDIEGGSALYCTAATKTEASPGTFSATATSVATDECIVYLLALKPAGGGAVDATGTLTVNSATATGGSHTATAAATATTTAGSATGAGGSQTATADVTATTTAGTATATGGTQTASVSYTGDVTAGTATASGGSQTATADTTGIVTAGEATASGGDHTASAGVAASVTAGTATASGGTHTGTAGSAVDATGTVTAGSASASGGTQTATAGASGTVAAGTATADGGSHMATAGTQATGNVSAGSASASGGAHTATAGASGSVTAGEAAASGMVVLATISADGVVTAGSATAAGGSHAASAGTVGLVAAGSAAASGGVHTASAVVPVVSGLTILAPVRVRSVGTNGRIVKIAASGRVREAVARDGMRGG